MRTPYNPPKQNGFGQFIDCVFLLILLYGSLMAPLLVDFGGGAGTIADTAAAESATWESLGQNEVMAGQWERLGHTPETAAPIITERFDYSIEPLSLALTVLIIAGYFIFVLKFSDREYRDVIAERFDR